MTLNQNEESIFLTQINLLDQAISLLQDRVSQLEALEKLKKLISNADKERSACVAIFKIRSIKFFIDTISYLVFESKRTDRKVHFFMLPNIRTLINVHANFLRLLEVDSEDRQALICISYQLLTTKKLRNDVEYARVLDMHKNFLATQTIIFPNSLEDFTSKWMYEQHLTLGKMDQLLEANVIKKYSLNVINIFTPKEPYRIYSALSEFLHANPYYYYEDPHNERFWIIACSMSTTAFLIEIIDTYFLNKINQRDFRIWLQEVKKQKTDFSNLWKSKTI